MAFDFTGGTATTRLNRTVAAAPAGAFSVGCWCFMDTWVAGRTFAMLGTSSTLFTGLGSGAATAQRFRLEVDYGTTNLVVEVAAAATGAWICVVAVFTNSTTATAHSIYTGSISSAMAAQAHVVDTNGAGTFPTSTAANIGRNPSASSAIDGRINQCFMVPWAMTADEVERYRQRDWSALFRGGNPTFFAPMLNGSSGLYDLAGAALWTNTGSTALAEDGPTAGSLNPRSAVDVMRRGATNTPKSLDGAITPAGVAPKLITKSLSGAFT